MKKIVLISISLAVCCLSYAQGEVARQTFKDTRIINGHSVETGPLGEMKFIISHRFGPVNQGVYELFGFDQSTIRIGLDYGISDRLTIGAGRSSFEKTYDGFAKFRAVHQNSSGWPLSVTAYTSANLTTINWPDPDRKNFFTSRMVYAHQLIIARKFSDAFSLQIMPTLVHLNLVPTKQDSHDVFSLGSALRWQLSKSLALLGEYYYNITNQRDPDLRNSLALGIEIETKGHVFQLSFSNSRGMTEKFFITGTRGRWQKAEVGLGFNITRDFRLRGR